MFTQVAAPGSPLSTGDLTLMIHGEIEGLATIETKNIFCCPPIPRTMSALAKMVIPENIMRANHDERHLIALAPEIEPQIMKWKIKKYSDQVFIEKSPWAGYIIYKKSGARILGLSNFEPGPSIMKLGAPLDSRETAVVDAVSCVDSGALEIVSYFVSEEKEHYAELVIVMLVVAQKFIELGYGIKEKAISQIIVRLSKPRESEEMSDEEEKIFAMRDYALRWIFGLPLGEFEPRDLRNRTGSVELIFGCEVSAIEGIVRKWLGPEPEEKAFV